MAFVDLTAITDTVGNGARGFISAKHFSPGNRDPLGARRSGAALRDVTIAPPSAAGRPARANGGSPRIRLRRRQRMARAHSDDFRRQTPDYRHLSSRRVLWDQD